MVSATTEGLELTAGGDAATLGFCPKSRTVFFTGCHGMCFKGFQVLFILTGLQK